MLTTHPVTINMRRLTTLFLLAVSVSLAVAETSVQQPSWKMDTLALAQVDTVSPRIVDQDPQAGKTLVQKDLRDVYRIGVLLPFQASDTASGASNRMASWSTDFYLGFKAAFDEPLPGRSKFEIRVFDTWGNDRKVEDLISKKRLDDLDVLVGPYRASSATILAKWAKEKDRLLLSPYTGNTRIGWGNANYLQMTPGLDRHLAKLLSLALEKTDPDGQVVFLYGDTVSEASKKLLWDSLVMSIPGRAKSRIISQTFSLSELDLSSLSIDSLLPNPMGTVVILPYWEESVVQAVIRKLVAEKADRKVTLLGLPQWLDFQLIQGAHWEALNTHISSADHYDLNDPQVVGLGKKFRDRYAQLLNRETVWGFRSGLWLRDRLEQDGAKFMTLLPDSANMAGSLPIPYFALTKNASGEVLQVVNEAIQILRYQDGSFLPFGL